MAIKLVLIDPPQAQAHIDLLQPIELTFVNPAGGELFNNQDTVTVNWTRDNPDVQYVDPNNVRIDLDRNNAGTFVEIVIASVDADDATDPLFTTFLATPTPGIALDPQARLRIVDLQTSNVVATSNYFTLKGVSIKIRLKGIYTVAS